MLDAIMQSGICSLVPADDAPAGALGVVAMLNEGNEVMKIMSLMVNRSGVTEVTRGLSAPKERVVRCAQAAGKTMSTDLSVGVLRRRCSDCGVVCRKAHAKRSREDS